MTEANARIIIDKLLRECDWVLSGDEGVVAVLRAKDEEAMKKLSENLLKHQEMYLVNKEKFKRMPNTKFVFKVDMEHHMISKFIGSGGSNINDLKESVILSDENLQGNKMSVSIHEDRKIRMKNLHFEHLDTEFDSESKVLVTVELNTTNRNATLETVRKYVKQFVEKANLSNFSNDQSASFTPQNDSGELENPF